MALLTRRQLIGAAAGLSLAGPLPALPASALEIRPRSSWGSDLPPKGPLSSEDVEFLIVHHSASRNGHTSADVPHILRSWFNYHTGPDKGWNDIAYNFVIDSEGVMWEGRQGSIDGAVAGDATGGNQGFTQLVCVIGDFNTAHPTPAALSSLVVLLAWLADRYGVPTGPGSEATFTSRGSNRWPEGAAVTTPTIVGHRAMSKTSCPGENLNSYVVGGLTSDVHAVRTGGAAAPATSTTTTSTTTTTTSTPTTTTTAPSTTTTLPASSTSPPTVSPTETSAVASASGPTSSSPPPATPTTTPLATPDPLSSPGATSPLLVGAGALVALGSGLLIWRHNRLNG